MKKMSHVNRAFVVFMLADEKEILLANVEDFGMDDPSTEAEDRDLKEEEEDEDEEEEDDEEEEELEGTEW